MSINSIGAGSALLRQYQDKLFAKLDSNANGSIDKSELKTLTDAVAAKTGKKIDSDALFKALDTAKTGAISKAQFEAAPPPPPPMSDAMQTALLQAQGLDTGTTADAAGTSVDSTSGTVDLGKMLDQLAAALDGTDEKDKPRHVHHHHAPDTDNDQDGTPATAGTGNTTASAAQSAKANSAILQYLAALGTGSDSSSTKVSVTA